MKTIYMLSDFGDEDTYVAQMKAVVIGIASPGIRIIDLTHRVTPGSVIDGAYHLWAANPFLQAGSVVIAVVDPGVGTDRMGIVCQGKGVWFVGPDNGLFSLLPLQRAWRLPDPSVDSSTTFHGRDVFAPAGARLAENPHWVMDLTDLSLEYLARCQVEDASVQHGSINATVIHADSFGNAILWLKPYECIGFKPAWAVLPDGNRVALTSAGTYGDNRGLLFIQGSQGLMELALSRGSASREFGLVSGCSITLDGVTV